MGQVITMARVRSLAQEAPHAKVQPKKEKKDKKWHLPLKRCIKNFDSESLEGLFKVTEPGNQNSDPTFPTTNLCSHLNRP